MKRVQHGDHISILWTGDSIVPAYVGPPEGEHGFIALLADGRIAGTYTEEERGKRWVPEWSSEAQAELRAGAALSGARTFVMAT